MGERKSVCNRQIDRERKRDRERNEEIERG